MVQSWWWIIVMVTMVFILVVALVAVEFARYRRWGLGAIVVLELTGITMLIWTALAYWTDGISGVDRQSATLLHSPSGRAIYVLVLDGPYGPRVQEVPGPGQYRIITHHGVSHLGITFQAETTYERVSE